MNRLYKYIIAATTVFALAACVEDEGNNIISEMNEPKVEGIDDTYTLIGTQESLVLNPEVTATMSGTDLSDFSYEWVLCNRGLTSSLHTHETIGHEKNLDFKLDIPAGTYDVYFTVKNNTSGMKWETVTTLNVVSPFVRGFYLLGDKEDGTMGIDFVSMINKRDTIVVENVFNNETGIRGAENLWFTGSTFNEDYVTLWATAGGESFRIETNPSLMQFNRIPDSSLETMAFPTLEVKKPYKVVDVIPHAKGSNNSNRSSSWRCMLLDDAAFFCGMMLSGEAYGNPVNRMSSGTSTLFKPSKYVFYADNAASGSSLYMAFYDETNNKFLIQNAAYYSFSNTIAPNDSPTPFYTDQNSYESVRHLVYGENGYTGGYSYALMTNAEGEYFVYKFKVTSYRAANGFTKQSAFTLDTSVATDFSKASHYAFFSSQPIILYSVGSKLYVYDYRRQDIKSYDMEGEITYLAMDAHSNDKPTDVIVATYSADKKGCVTKYTIKDDANEIELTQHEKDVWRTGLKVVKVEYRNSTM